MMDCRNILSLHRQREHPEEYQCQRAGFHHVLKGSSHCRRLDRTKRALEVNIDDRAASLSQNSQPPLPHVLCHDSHMR